MVTRRALLVASVSALIPIQTLGALLQQPKVSFKGDEVFERIVTKAAKEGWEKKPLGELMGLVAQEFLGTPYVAYTLELDDSAEYCAINLHGLDCVTFFESTLNLSRIIRAGTPTKEAFLSAVRQTRYRGGVQSDYTSRLHYTTDWFYDNVKKGIVADLTPTLPGAAPFTQKVGYMTAHPEVYRQLKANPGLVPQIKKFEDAINQRSRTYIPIEKVAEIERFLQTGDIIGICSSQEGIDIAHTGLCFRDAEGVLHFMDASSAQSKRKVTLEVRLSDAIRGSRRNTGIIVARPL